MADQHESSVPPDRHWLEAFLRSLGVGDVEVGPAAESGVEALQALAINHIAGIGPGALTRQEMAEATGVDIERIRRFWRAMGFPDVDDEAPVFTDGDVEVLRIVRQVLEGRLAPETEALQIVRTMGQALSRVAESQIAALGTRVDLRTSDPDPELLATVDQLIRTFRPLLERTLVFVWRRHVAAAAQREIFVSAQGPGEACLGIGFADLVRFTALSQELDEASLATLVDRFETIAFETVSGHGGRVVKMIGDEVMFAAGEPAGTAAIALDLLDACVADPALPPVRIGAAWGPVVSVVGDHFGRTVNLASRLVGVARPGTVVVSSELRDALEDAGDLDLVPIRPRTLKGIGREAPWVLRRAG